MSLVFASAPHRDVAAQDGLGAQPELRPNLRKPLGHVMNFGRGRAWTETVPLTEHRTGTQQVVLGVRFPGVQGRAYLPSSHSSQSSRFK